MIHEIFCHKSVKFELTFSEVVQRNNSGILGFSPGMNLILLNPLVQRSVLSFENLPYIISIEQNIKLNIKQSLMIFFCCIARRSADGSFNCHKYAF